MFVYSKFRMFMFCNLPLPDVHLISSGFRFLLLPPKLLLALMLFIVFCSSCTNCRWLQNQVNKGGAYATVIIIPPERDADWLLVDKPQDPEVSVVSVYRIDGYCVPQKKKNFRLSPGLHLVVYEKASLDYTMKMINGTLDALNDIKAGARSYEDKDDWLYKDPADGLSIRKTYFQQNINFVAGKTYVLKGDKVIEE